MSASPSQNVTNWEYDKAVEYRVTTCDLCLKKRKCGRFGRYYYRCRECFPIRFDSPEMEAMKEERAKTRQERNLKQRKAYPCIGGPLDGQHATTYDFYDDGVFAHLRQDYAAFNRAGGAGAKMVFVHDPRSAPLRMMKAADR